MKTKDAGLPNIEAAIVTVQIRDRGAEMSGSEHNCLLSIYLRYPEVIDNSTVSTQQNYWFMHNAMYTPAHFITALRIAHSYTTHTHTQYK